jgi:hypothetical protein
MAARKKATEAKVAEPTTYVVLQCHEAQLAPVDDNPVVETVWLPVSEQVPSGEGQAFQIKLFRAASKMAAIRQHTGTGADVIAGTFKAIPWSSWKGGETTRTKITAERLPLEEAM